MGQFWVQINTEQGYVELRLADKTLLSAESGRVKHHEGAMSPASLVDAQWRLAQAGAYQLIAVDGKIQALAVSQHQQLLDEIWSVQFEPGWDVPAELSFSELMPLQQHDNAAVQHYSGSISYSTHFNYQANGAVHQLLDLGRVHNIAEVTVNGQLVGTRLSEPYVFDVSKYLVEGENQVQVVVTNTWRNQLILDVNRPEDKRKTWTTNPPKASDTALEHSGLVGPVKLVSTHLF